MNRLLVLMAFLASMALLPIASNLLACQIPETDEKAPIKNVAPIDQEEQPTEEPAKKQTFMDIVKKIRANERSINRLFSTVPIGFPEEQDRHMAEIERLRGENKQLKVLMESAALEALRDNPQGDARAVRVAFNLLSEKLDVNKRDGHFDPVSSLEIADIMLKNKSAEHEGVGITPTEVTYQAFRASFAIQDFERADQLLKQIEDSGVSLRAEIRQQLENTKEKWNRELLIRRQEAINDDLPRVKLETTGGDIVVELFENHAPQTVANFISLVENDTYNNSAFFQVIPGEFAWGGCPLDNGQGDPGYRIACEIDREQIRHHFTGSLSMAHQGKDTGGSQFRIMHQPSSKFDGTNTVFGRVIEGMDVIYQMTAIDPAKTLRDETEPPRIKNATVLRKRNHEYTFSKIPKGPGVSLPDSPFSIDQD